MHLEKMHHNLKKEQVCQSLCHKRRHRKTKLKWKKNKKQAESLSLSQKDMQCEGAKTQAGRAAAAEEEEDGDDDGGEGRQTDPVVDFPKHCFLSYTFFRHRMFLTAETKVMMWQRREIQRRSFSRFAFRRGREGGSSSRVGGLEDDRMEVEEGGNKERRSKSVCRWTKESSVANRGTEIKTSTHINIYIYIKESYRRIMKLRIKESCV